MRHIPTSDVGSVDGWDGSTGWRAFLEWAWEANQFDFYPDKDVGTNWACYLEEPRGGAPSLEPTTARRRLRLVIRSVSSSDPFTGYSL